MGMKNKDKNIKNIFYDEAHNPICKKGLSQYTLTYLQEWCEMRNDSAKRFPEFYKDELYQSLTVDLMAIEHIQAALEAKSLVCDVCDTNLISDEDWDILVELEKFIEKNS